MRLKKSLSVGAAALMAALVFVTPVSAHGCHGRSQTSTAVSQRQVCCVEDCTEPGRHCYDGVEYCGYDHEDGYCDDTCPRLVCSLEDCTESGRHYHDDIEYCGYNHKGDYCDNTCVTSRKHHNRRRHCH